MIDRARVVVIGGESAAVRSSTGWRASLERRGARGAIGADERLHVPLGRTGRPTSQLTRTHANDDELRRSLPNPRRGGRSRDGWREVGSLRLASSNEHMEELERQAAWRRRLVCRCISSRPTKPSRCFLHVDRGRAGAALLPSDGYVDPSQLTLALAPVPVNAARRSSRTPA